jgi:hypothetical protein
MEGQMEQRRRTRVSTDKRVTVSWLHGERLGEIVNLSLKGCLITASDVSDLIVGQPASVIIHLDPGLAHQDVRAHGRIVRLGPSGLAIDFVEIEAASFPPLLRLVRYNAPHPEEVEQELRSFAFETFPPEAVPGESSPS